MMGHNSSTYGQMLKPVLPAAPKGPKQRFPYFKFYPRDWLESTRDLSLEQRGAYIDLICILMEMEGYLADNDKWISHQMHVSPRKWKALKNGLVDHEKIAIQDGQIVNDRCLKEINALMLQRQNISGSAVKRERNKRETSVKHPGNIHENPEKPNKNNGDDVTVVPLRARVLDLDLDKEEERERKRGDAQARGPVPQEGFAKMASALAAGIAVTMAPVGLAASPVEQTVQVMQGVAECWQTPKARHDAGVNIHEKRTQHQIWMTPLGVLEVAGDFRAELEREFPLVDLKEGLAVAAPSVRLTEGAIRATQAIRRSFSYRQRDASDKQRRAPTFVDKAAVDKLPKTWQEKQDAAYDYIFRKT